MRKRGWAQLWILHRQTGIYSQGAGWRLVDSKLLKETIRGKGDSGLPKRQISIIRHHLGDDGRWRTQSDTEGNQILRLGGLWNWAREFALKWDFIRKWTNVPRRGFSSKFSQTKNLCLMLYPYISIMKLLHYISLPGQWNDKCFSVRRIFFQYNMLKQKASDNNKFLHLF